jgi:hypothetical protein
MIVRPVYFSFPVQADPMIRNILIDPENRLLNSYGTDFGLLAAPPIAFSSFMPSGWGVALSSTNGAVRGESPVLISSAPASNGDAVVVPPGSPWTSLSSAGSEPPATARISPDERFEGAGDGRESSSTLQPSTVAESFSLELPNAASSAPALAIELAGSAASFPITALSPDAVVTSLVAAVSESAGLPLDALTGALAGPLADVEIGAAIGEASDDVSDLLGADPAGGIATLVSLVSVTDVFDFGQMAGEDELAAPATDQGLVLLEDLASEMPAISDPDEVEEASGAVPFENEDPLHIATSNLPDPFGLSPSPLSDPIDGDPLGGIG